MSAWYDNRSKLEVVNLKIWGQLKVFTNTSRLVDHLCVMSVGSGRYIRLIGTGSAVLFHVSKRDTIFSSLPYQHSQVRPICDVTQ